ncbi:hypothetical protein EK904_004368 [Melospiza melodia maxima]|nr:hypothetical protein EK904_004368 [Melospiza melodia maxima]
MQQQELAQMRQRDANLTALAAIGPRKKRKVDSPGSGSGTEQCGEANSPALPRVLLTQSEHFQCRFRDLVRVQQSQAALELEQPDSLRDKG